MVSQTPAASHSPDPARHVALVAGFAVPSWLISILVHAGLLGAMGTLTWSVARTSPDREFTVGIMIKKETPDGQVFESKDSTFTPHEQPAQPNFLPDSMPAAVAESLPQLPDIDLSTIGISGSMLAGTGELLALPDAGGQTTGAMANTQFFGAKVWGSKFVYIIDRSGSMSQRDRLGAAKRELLGSLALLPPETQFQIIFYNMRSDILPVGGSTRRLLAATDQNKTLAARFVDGVIADGGTEHLPALKMAIALGPDVIFFLTDADDLRARDVTDATELNRDRARIHTIAFGIGPETDGENTLKDLAQRNGGTYRYIDAAKLGGTGIELRP